MVNACTADELDADTMSRHQLSIGDTLRGKNLFITGTTGAIGKALVEKILRSAPDVGRLFLLIRPSKTRRATERLNEEVRCMLTVFVSYVPFCRQVRWVEITWNRNQSQL